VALLEAAANIAVAVTPSGTWTPEQTAHYVEAQHLVSDLTGHHLAQNVELGYDLPNWAPADRLFVEGYCNSVWISDGEAPPNSPFVLGLGWLRVEKGPHGSLCPLLVDKRSLTPVLWTSLVRADAVFLHAHGSISAALLSHKVVGASPTLATSRLIGALRQFDVSLEHLMNVGLPSAHARALTTVLLADTGSLKGALANAARQNDQSKTVAAWTEDVNSRLGRTTSDYTSLLHELVVPATS
jgi:hypothetical protein